MAYSELLTDERKDTAAGFWTRANAYFEGAGITVTPVLRDNGACYRSHAIRDALGTDIRHKRTRPYQFQTNGKVDRFNRTMLEERAYAPPLHLRDPTRRRLQRLPAPLQSPPRHTALNGSSPADRVPKLAGQCT